MCKMCNICKMCNSYQTMSSAIWQIFYELFIFYDLFHDSSGEWNYSKIQETSIIFINIVQGYCAV